MSHIGLASGEAAEVHGSGNILMKHSPKNLKGSLRVEVGQQLLPGIPDEITIDLVAPKLPWTVFYRLSSVSHAWQQAIHTRQIYDARVRSQSPQTIVVMKERRGNHVGALALYSISDDTCYRLPPMPGLDDSGALPRGYQCVPLHGKVYVLGGNAPKDGKSGKSTAGAVYVLDLAALQKWKQCASMGDPRTHFGCGFINGKIYVFGGISPKNVMVCGSEVYDLESDAWSAIAPINFAGFGYGNIITVGEELLLYNRRLYDKDFSEVYNPLNNRCRAIDHFGKYFKVMLMMGGKLHKLTSRGIEVYDMAVNSWKASHSFSLAIFGLPGSFTVDTLAAVAVDDELVALVSWRKLYGKYKDATRGTRLLRSKGLGAQSRAFEWQDTQCSWSSNDRHNSHYLSTFQL